MSDILIFAIGLAVGAWGIVILWEIDHWHDVPDIPIRKRKRSEIATRKEIKRYPGSAFYFDGDVRIPAVYGWEPDEDE